MGKPHINSSNYIVDLFKYFKLVLKSEQGLLDLRPTLINLPSTLGVSMFSKSNRDIIIHGFAQPIDYTPTSSDLAFNYLKNENVSLQAKVE